MAITKQDYCKLKLGSITARAVRCYIDADSSASGSISASISDIECSIYHSSLFVGSDRVTSYALNTNGTYLGDLTGINVYRSDANISYIRYLTTNVNAGATPIATNTLRIYFSYFLVLISSDDKKAVFLVNSFDRIPDNYIVIYPTEGELGYITGSGTTSTAGVGYNSSTWNYSDVIDVSDITNNDDPYEPGGTSGTGGGDGSFNLQNDSIDFPSLPTLSAVDTGLVSIYTPSLAQLKALATFLWNANPTDVDWWKKLVANPLDLILGLSIVPVQVPQGASQTIKVGLIDTGVSVTKAASQFVTVDCGSVTIQKNCGGSALDYSPFTKFSLYLPFIGTRTISCDDIMGRTVHVKYNVDLLSGGCTAMVKITGGPDDNQLDAILYQYSGACAISIPLTGETFTNMITSTIQLAASIGATVATGGAAAGVTAASAANSLMSMKPIIERAGGVSGAAGQLGIMQPYLIAEVPRQSVPENCNTFTGYPSNMKATIGDLTGYTEVEIVHLQGIEATQAELDELESVLKGGFII